MHNLFNFHYYFKMMKLYDQTKCMIKEENLLVVYICY